MDSSSARERGGSLEFPSFWGKYTCLAVRAPFVGPAEGVEAISQPEQNPASCIPQLPAQAGQNVALRLPSLTAAGILTLVSSR